MIEITNSVTNTLLAKVRKSNISGFHAFTVRNLDTNIEQYKLLYVREDPINPKQQHLDAFLHCFPPVNLARTNKKQVGIQ